MKKKLLTFMLAGAIGCAFGQSANKGVVGKAKTFASLIEEMENPSNKLDDERPIVSLKTNHNKTFDAVVNLKRTEDGISEIIGGSKSDPTSSFYLLTDKEGDVSGMYFSIKEKVAYIYSTDKNTGMLVATEDDINKHICFNYEAAPWAKVESDEGYPLTSDRPQPKLSSRPEARAVIYLDFDGEVVTGRWNNGRTINAKSYNYSDKEIEDQWEIVAEDFRPYDVNVTTDRAMYDKAPKGSRMMCITTPTNDAAPGAGGVAYIGSFSDGRDDPCWTFNRGNKTGGETSSHEVGHTVSLQHDGQTGGTTYYMGHGDWAPIMGASYRRPIGHWSKGEYPQANQKQDDLQVMTRHFPFLKDDVGNDMAGAKALVSEADGKVSGEKNNGIIGMTNDIDMFKITVSSKGEVDLKIEPFYRYPNLNVKARLLDKDGKEVAASDPQGVDNMFGQIKEQVDAGTYYLEIDGVGEGNLNTGYGDYNSMGGYEISGTVPAGGTLPVAMFSSDKKVTCAGQEIKFKDESTGDPTKWEWVFENGDPATSTEQNPTVTYNKSGKHKVALTVTNGDGENTKTENEYITISEAKSLPVVEGFEGSFPASDWTLENPDSDITWEKSTKAGVDSKSCMTINNADYSKVGEKDALLIPEVDLTGSADDPALTFYVAYTRFDEKSEDKLKVFISDDCGESWDEVYYKQKDKLETKDVDFDESQDWIPESVDDWRFEIIDLTKYKENKSVQIKFENTTGYGNHVWIDNINIDYSLGTKLSKTTIENLNVAPNPSNGMFELRFSAQEMANFNIEVRNILGEVIHVQTLNNFKGNFRQNFDLSKVAKGVYFLNIQDKQSSITKKLVKN